MRRKTMSEQNLNDLDLDLFLKACLSHIAQEIERSNHNLAEEDFRKGLQSLLEEILANAPDKESPLSYLAMILEGFVHVVSKITVTMAAVDPLIFERSGVLPEDQTKLLRRGIEDSIVELVGESLKRYVLDNHLALTKFKEEKES
jgi:hypothetical protein